GLNMVRAKRGLGPLPAEMMPGLGRAGAQVGLMLWPTMDQKALVFGYGAALLICAMGSDKLVADFVKAATASQKQAEKQPCPHCGTRTAGKFCHDCGGAVVRLCGECKALVQGGKYCVE